jgi:hypothetical protein
MAAFAIQTAWGEQIAPEFLITSDSAIPLTSANTLPAVTVNAARSTFAPDTTAVVETINRSKIDARNIVNSEDALMSAPQSDGAQALHRRSQFSFCRARFQRAAKCSQSSMTTGCRCRTCPA